MTDEFTTVATLQLKKWEDPWPPDCQPNKKPQTPSEWFSKRFPEQASIFGTPFLEVVHPQSDGLDKINPISANIDFFAGILGGNKSMGHQVVYFQPQMEFYFYDVRDKIFKPTSDEKLGNLLRALLMKCAEELPDEVHKYNLFQEFRSDKTVRSIVRRAKSVLAADHSFFSVDSKNERQKGPELYERLTRVYAEEILERQEGSVLTLAHAFMVFQQFLKQRDMPHIKRTEFKAMLAPVVRDTFNLGLRNDVFDQTTQHQTIGWKGLRAVEVERN